MTIKDIKDHIRQAQIDAAEALFEQNPSLYIEKYIDMSESRFTSSLPPDRKRKKKQKP